jgi:hypothetical protein
MYSKRAKMMSLSSIFFYFPIISIGFLLKWEKNRRKILNTNRIKKLPKSQFLSERSIRKKTEFKRSRKMRRRPLR